MVGAGTNCNANIIHIAISTVETLQFISICGVPVEMRAERKHGHTHDRTVQKPEPKLTTYFQVVISLFIVQMKYERNIKRKKNIFYRLQLLAFVVRALSH